MRGVTNIWIEGSELHYRDAQGFHRVVRGEIVGECIIKGTIMAQLSDAEWLLEIEGLTLGEYRDGRFQNCTVTESALVQLDQYWGKIFWSFEM